MGCKHAIIARVNDHDTRFRLGGQVGVVTHRALGVMFSAVVPTTVFDRARV
jgi:hypothetical protein